MEPIDELIFRSVKGKASPAEERRLLEWRSASTANDEYHAQMVRMLEAVRVVARPRHAVPEPTAADIISLADTAAGGADPREASSGLGRAGRLTPGLIAATVVLLLALGGLYSARRDTAPPFSMGAGEYVSGPNETTTATLADGTVVRLAPDSRLRILDTPGRREVFLSGRAYLAVAHMSDRPFRVRTPVGEVVVLGTRFDVQARDELRLVVVEGKVELSGEGDRERVEVGAGEMSIVTGGEVMRPVEVDVRPLVAWVGRFIAFQATPLREVARDLEREYDARVILTDSGMAGLTITGSYIDRSFEEVVVILCGVLGARCSVQDGVATIGR